MRGFGTESIRSVERGTAAADTLGSRGAWGPLSILVQIAAWGLITVPAWLLGGVQAETQFWLFVVGVCAMLACWGICLGRAMSVCPLPIVLVPLALAVVMGVLQTISLPAPSSPGSAHAGVAGRSDAKLTLRPSAGNCGSGPPPISIMKDAFSAVTGFPASRSSM